MIIDDPKRVAHDVAGQASNKGASQDGNPKQAVAANDAEYKELVAAAPQLAIPTSPVSTPDPMIAAMSPQQMATLLQLFLAREQRAAAKEEAEELRIRTRKERYEQNRADDGQNTRNIQAKCDHLKGGKFKKPGENDHSVIVHRFIDNTLYIKCQLCKMKWYPPDTREVIFRGGVALPNHTGIGWAEAALFVRSSTNKASRSEVPGEMASRIQAKEDIPATGNVIAAR